MNLMLAKDDLCPKSGLQILTFVFVPIFIYFLTRVLVSIGHLLDRGHHRRLVHAAASLIGRLTHPDEVGRRERCRRQL